jgi:hypothetical protein
MAGTPPSSTNSIQEGYVAFGAAMVRSHRPTNEEPGSSVEKAGQTAATTRIATLQERSTAV